MCSGQIAFGGLSDAVSALLIAAVMRLAESRAQLPSDLPVGEALVSQPAACFPIIAAGLARPFGGLAAWRGRVLPKECDAEGGTVLERVARFDLHPSEVQAMHALAKRALFACKQVDLLLRDDLSLSVSLNVSRHGLRFDVQTPLWRPEFVIS